MLPININFDKHVQGDSWLGVPTIGPIRLKGNLPMPSSIQHAIMQFKRSPNSDDIEFSLSTTTGGIVIVDANNWEMTIPPVPPSIFKLSRRIWHWSLRITDTDGIALTYYHGQLEVISE